MLVASLPTPAFAQAGGATPTIDTIVIQIDNVFSAEEAEASRLARGMNRFRFPTREYVIRSRLLFRQGDTYDAARLAETARNLADLQILQEIDIDTTRVGGRLAVLVRVRDSWSTSPKVSFQVASDGTWTGAIGVTESNLLGTGNLAHIARTREVDRSSTDLSGKFSRVFADVDIEGMAQLKSDGTIADWLIGSPFRSIEDAGSIKFEGGAADQRVLQFARDGAVLDTTIYQRGAFLARATVAGAPSASTAGFVRAGGMVQLRQERYALESIADLGAVEDTINAAFGGFVEVRRARYWTVTHFNGFVREDVDLSIVLNLSTWLAPPALGYGSMGIGPAVTFKMAAALPRGFVAGAVEAGGLFAGGGLDSGRVEVSATLGLKPGPRQATALHVRAGALESVQPGREFDLGFETVPRSWEPHSFVGTRSVWGVLEHRWYVADNVANLFGLGLASFLEYGGAWYPGEARRFGGDVGVGVRLGSAVGALPRTGRFDLGYRFGNGVTGDRWVFSVGAGFVFGVGDDPSCLSQVYEVADVCRSRR